MEADRRVKSLGAGYRFFSLLKGEWRAATIVISSILAVTLMGLVDPWVWGILLVNGIVTGRDLSLLPMVIAILVGTAVGRNVFSFIKGYWAQTISQRITYKLRVQLFRHLEALSLRFHDEHGTGELISRITNDVNVLEGSISDLITDLLPDAAMLIGTIALMVYINAGITLIVAATFPGMMWVAYTFKGRVRSTSKLVQESMGHITSRVHETLSGIRIVQSFSRENDEAKRFEEAASGNVAAQLQSQKLSSTYSSAVDLLTTAGSLIVLVLYLPGVVQNPGTFGAMIAFLGYLGLMYGPLRGVSRFQYSMAKGHAAAERILEVLDSTPEVTDDRWAVGLTRVSGDVSFNNVTFGYSRSLVLDHLSFCVRAGQRVALVGPSGVGKSTVANLLLRFYDPWEGQVRVDSWDLRTVKLMTLRRQIGFVAQDPYLFNGTVAENITYGDPNASQERAAQAAKLANAHEFITKLPMGYKTVVGERGIRLSVGQRQRIAIARALLRDPRILVFDEATSNLDSVSEELIRSSLEVAFKGRTVFIIAHRLATVVNADVIIVLSDGKATEVGKHEELLARGGLYAELYRTQVASLLERHSGEKSKSISA